MAPARGAAGLTTSARASRVSASHSGFDMQQRRDLQCSIQSDNARKTVEVDQQDNLIIPLAGLGRCHSTGTRAQRPGKGLHTLKSGSGLSGPSLQGLANVLCRLSGELRLSPRVVRSVPSASVVRSGSVMRMTLSRPRSPNTSGCPPPPPLPAAAGCCASPCRCELDHGQQILVSGKDWTGSEQKVTSPTMKVRVRQQWSGSNGPSTHVTEGGVQGC